MNISDADFIYHKHNSTIKRFHPSGNSVAPAHALARLNYFRRALGRMRKTIASHS